MNGVDEDDRKELLENTEDASKRLKPKNQECKSVLIRRSSNASCIYPTTSMHTD